MASPMHSSHTPSSSSQSLPTKYVDRELLEEQFLQCTICFEKYDQNTRSPKLLPCSHTFCTPCLQNIMTTSGRQIRQLRCPLCNTEHRLTKDGLRKFPTDYRIVQMIDFLCATDATQDTVYSQVQTHEPHYACHQHPNQVLNLFCKTCEVLVCKECVEKLHSEKGFRLLLQMFMMTDSSIPDSKSHVVTEFSEAFKELMKKTVSIKDRTKRIVEKLQAKSDLLETYSQQLKDDIAREEASINQTFAVFKEILDQRRQELLGQLKTEMNKSQHMIQKRMFAINTKIPTIVQLQEEFENVKRGKDYWQLRSLARRMEQWESSTANLFNCLDNFDYRRFQYATKQSDRMFPSFVKELGDIKNREPVTASRS